LVLIFQQNPHSFGQFSGRSYPFALNSATQMPLSCIEITLVAISYNLSRWSKSVDVKKIA